MCANRGEIAIRVFRAATELGIKTVSIFTHEDRLHIHRMKADESYMLGGGENKTPVGAYLDINEIIKIAKGYGFLSENAQFAEACENAGIIFVGPSVQVLKSLGDKTEAKLISKNAEVPCIPGSQGAISSYEEAKKQVDEMGLPVMIKASMGGGGRGMRVVKDIKELKDSFLSASSEAKSFFGDGSVFIEKYIEKPRHIEVQILGDSEGNIIHLFERDCSIQRRHQKVVEIAPAYNLDEKLRQKITNDAVKIAKYVGYKNAGTVEFLVDQNGNHYFIEVNPRIQVEHTVTEEVTGIDLVQSQIKIASGMNFKEIGLKQEDIKLQGYAIQCRVTTEDPQKDFQPDHGKLEVFRSPEGFGIRLDSTAGIYGIVITPHYDSLLSKVTARGKTYQDAIHKLSRALSEFRIRGVKTNVPFVSRILSHPDFLTGKLHTGFIADNPDLFKFKESSNRAHKLLGYFAATKVNGISVAGADVKIIPPDVDPILPHLLPIQNGWRQIFLDKGPKEFAIAVRSHDKALLMDTTLRDAHQSLLATRMRTYDMLKIAPITAGVFHKLYSLEMWGGATFDVSLRFLKECPWDRLRKLREAIPNIPFQMLLRGANAVGYTSYPDNVVYKFVKESKENGIDIFRIFDSLNYVENLKLGIDAVGEAGGVIETSICYTGNVLNPKNNKYNIGYYMKLVDEVVKLGTHVLNIKDMAGLLTPECANFLVSTIRKEYPDLPIHVHTHDTAGTGVASMIASIKAGADVIDVATDAMCGLTSQPSMGAIIASLKETKHDTGIDLNSIQGINDYWEQIRELYGPFESGQKSAGADVFINEMPGGQYTNLLFQSKSLGLADQWPKVKKAFSDANELLGDIVKVTPSSKVVGDLAQYMVTNSLTPEAVKKNAKNLDFPSSVIDYFQGYLGIPHGGFPEPLRTDIIKDAKRITGRPGASLPPMDLQKLKVQLVEKYGDGIRDVDVMSSAMYPKVFDEYMDHLQKYGDVSVLTTKQFIAPLEFGKEVEVVLERGKTVYVKLTSVGALDKASGKREVFFDLNGIPRSVMVDDTEAQKNVVKRLRADPSNVNSVGAPMPGSIIEIKVKNGDKVEKGQPIIVLSAMKMETIVRSSATGKVTGLDLKVGDELKAGDLLLKIE